MSWERDWEGWVTRSGDYMATGTGDIVVVVETSVFQRLGVWIERSESQGVGKNSQPE